MFTAASASVRLTLAIAITAVFCFSPIHHRVHSFNFQVASSARRRHFPEIHITPLFQRDGSGYKRDLGGLNVALKQTETSRSGKRRTRVMPHHYSIILATIFLAFTATPRRCFASGMVPLIPTPNEFKDALVPILDRLSQSGKKGLVIYTLVFMMWTGTVGVTTPVETAAGAAFPLKTAISLSAIGKMGGAMLQYMTAKYLFSEYAAQKLKDNKWMGNIKKSFRSHQYRVALIWRFSPLPEFVKNVGPALVPNRTWYQILAILSHGLPFTVLWSCMGNDFARVARGGEASSIMKMLTAAISWIGLFVSPTLFGWWVKGLGSLDDNEEE